MPRQLADMEWDTMHHGSDLELSSNCLTANKTSSSAPSTVRGTILYTGTGALGRGHHQSGGSGNASSALQRPVFKGLRKGAQCSPEMCT